MIIANGRLRFKRSEPAAAELDPATGYPVAAAVQWDAGVPCQYVAQQFNNLGAVYGERFRTATWVVYVDLPCAERRGLCRLENRVGAVVAEAEIVSWAPLDAVNQARILL